MLPSGSRDELEYALRAHGALEVTDRQVSVLDDEPREHGLVVLEGACRRVTRVAEVEQVTAHLLTERLLLPAPVAHRVLDDDRRFS
jgi:hypothetical protein